ncbi:hypothetical protein U1Q18_005492 [Sarracenia purpurea var. burkii]
MIAEEDAYGVDRLKVGDGSEESRTKGLKKSCDITRSECDPTASNKGSKAVGGGVNVGGVRIELMDHFGICDHMALACTPPTTHLQLLRDSIVHED